MKFISGTKSRAGNRRRRQPAAPAQVEICESRLLLTSPNILTPTSTVTADSVDFSWEAVDNADSYELWVTSLETYERIYHNDDIAGTAISVDVDQLSLGRIRIWARANLSGGGTSAWSPAATALIRSTPSITGPLASPGGSVAANATDDNTPEITWTSADGASYFDIWVTNVEAKAKAEEAAAAASAASGTTVEVDVTAYAKVYRVENRELDDNGQIVRDASGLPVLREVRSFVLPESPDDPDSEDLELDLGRYQIWMRSYDDSFEDTPRQSPAWSSGHSFQIVARPDELGPSGSTFQTSPLLTWNSVQGATHYEVFVNEAGSSTALFRRTIAANADSELQSTQIVLSQTGLPIVDDMDDEVMSEGETELLDSFGNPVLFELPHRMMENDLLEEIVYTPDGRETSYTLWVRALRVVEDMPTTLGLWNSSTFSTVAPPQITQPVGEDANGSRIVTSLRPTVEWTAIEGAAQHEILVNKFNSRPTYLEAQSNNTSYTFMEDVPEGSYTIWVRGIDSRGRYSEWSDGFEMTTSGGKPVILTPTEGQTVTFVTFSWLEVDNAASYEIWAAELGVDFTAINVDGITETSFSPVDPLNNSQYRVWIRALLTDGTYSAWSNPVTFQGGVVQTEDGSDDALMLVSADIEVPVESLPEPTIEVVAENSDAESAEESLVVQPPGVEDGRTAAVADAAAEESDVSAADGVEPVDGPAFDALAKIAQNCVDVEWWQAETPPDSV